MFFCAPHFSFLSPLFHIPAQTFTLRFTYLYYIRFLSKVNDDAQITKTHILRFSGEDTIFHWDYCSNGAVCCVDLLCRPKGYNLQPMMLTSLYLLPEYECQYHIYGNRHISLISNFKDLLSLSSHHMAQKWKHMSVCGYCQTQQSSSKNVVLGSYSGSHHKTN